MSENPVDSLKPCELINCFWLLIEALIAQCGDMQGRLKAPAHLVPLLYSGSN